ncbi:MAG: glycerol-3-phosphate dehydrogenase [Sandaracinaceae bacterium]|nr:glycerol-3-phosphate dehydrogenase [Sandaracinaceae bacterium]
MGKREDMWGQLDQPVDVLVIGGGITGSGIARDAARRGLKVAVVEQRDLAFGTSSRSSKLVHGGLRYLESYEFSLVFESVSERRVLMDLAPHLVNPLGFLFPVYKGARQSLFVINAGMWLYDGLSLFRSPKIHKKLKPKEVAELEPAVKQEGLKGAPLYYDCSTDDARLTIETALDAVQHGAVVATYARVESFLKDDNGRIQGAVVKCQTSGQLKEVRASVVVNATGPWTDKTMAMSGTRKGNLLRPTKGVHIVVEFDKLPIQHAVVCFHPTDERVLFALPWGDRTYIGTTDTDYDGDEADVAATLEDVDYLIAASNSYFPDHVVGRSDVIATWAGLRPLIAPPSSEGDAEDGGEVSESKVSREHQILVGQDGLITIAGGKLTTYRKMAAELVDTAVDLLRLMGKLPGKLTAAETDKHPLPGGVGWPADDDHAKVTALVVQAGRSSLTADTARFLADTYGMRALELAKRCAADPSLAKPLIPGRLEIVAQVDWALEQELAHSLSDVLTRRTQLFYKDTDQGLGCAEAVAARMAAQLGWDEARVAAELASYRDDVARSRAWRASL